MKNPEFTMVQKTYLLLSLILLIPFHTTQADTYVPEEGSAELLKQKRVKIPYDAKLPNILIIGDSISMGYTPFVAKLLKGKANIIHNPGNSQGTTYSKTQISKWLSSKPKWDVIHFNWGLHDLKHVTTAGTSKNSNSFDDPQQADLETYTSNLKELVKELKKTGAKLIFATTTPYPDGVKPARKPSDAVAYNSNALEIMKANNIAINDLYASINPFIKQLQKKANVHFSKEGSLFMARKVSKYIEDALKK
jgi:lysophospholipase L1-like esterase